MIVEEAGRCPLSSPRSRGALEARTRSAAHRGVLRFPCFTTTYFIRRQADMRIRTFLGLAAVAAMALGAPEAHAANLTGIWAGEQKCDRFDGQKFHTTFGNDIMVITQNGQQVHIAALLIDDVFQLVYQGTVINDGKKPEREAEVGFTECTTTPTSPYQETARATKVTVKANGNADFDATSIFLQLATDDSPTDTGTCTWRYKRIDTLDVGVPDCA